MMKTPYFNYLPEYLGPVWILRSLSRLCEVDFCIEKSWSMMMDDKRPKGRIVTVKLAIGNKEVGRPWSSTTNNDIDQPALYKLLSLLEIMNDKMNYVVLSYLL